METEESERTEKEAVFFRAVDRRTDQLQGVDWADVKE